MRILVVSDNHGNWPALAAIDEPHDVCLCLGDLVDYGPDPAACVRWAMTHARYAIHGNHDHGAAQGVEIKGESGYRYLTRVSRSLVWDALGPNERRWLLQLPLTQWFNVGNKRFLMVHATPRDPLDEYLKHNPKLWAKRPKNVEADIVLVGHSHMQFNLAVNGTVVVNPGSVGQQRDGDPRTAYALIDGNKIELKRLAYSIDQVIARVEASPLPERAKELLRHSFRLGRLTDAKAEPDPDLASEDAE